MTKSFQYAKDLLERDIRTGQTAHSRDYYYVMVVNHATE